MEFHAILTETRVKYSPERTCQRSCASDGLRWGAWRFVAGTPFEDVVAVSRALNDQGLTVTLDHLAIKWYVKTVDAMPPWALHGHGDA